MRASFYLKDPLTMLQKNTMIDDDQPTFTFDDRHWRVRGLEKQLSCERMKVNLMVTRRELVHVDTLDLYTYVSIGKLCEVHARTHPGRLLRSPQRRRCARALSPPRQWLRQLAERLLGWLGRAAAASSRS